MYPMNVLGVLEKLNCGTHWYEYLIYYIYTIRILIIKYIILRVITFFS